MDNELTILGWTLVLALVQIMLTASMRTSETGLSYNMGPRDEPAKPPRPITARRPICLRRCPCSRPRCWLRTHWTAPVT